MFCPAKRQRTADNNDDDADAEEKRTAYDQMAVPMWAMTRDALGLAAGDYLENADAQVAEEKPAEDKEYYEPRMLPTRRKELKQLGKPGPRAECFLCCYVGERDVLLPGDEIHKIIDYLRTHIGKMDTIAMATQVSKFYETFRHKVNSKLSPNETRLPPLSPATVLDHLRNHTHDPEVKLIIMLDEAQELRQTILKSVLERSSKSRKTRANKNQIDCLEKIAKYELSLQTRDPSKMMMYSAGARIDPTIHKQGPVATTNKTLFSYWRKRARP